MRTCENATCTRRQSRATHTMASGVHLCDDCYITSLHERVISLEQLIVDLQREMFPRGMDVLPPSMPSRSTIERLKATRTLSQPQF